MRLYFIYKYYTPVLIILLEVCDYHFKFRGPLSISIYILNVDVHLFLKVILSLHLKYRPDLFEGDSWS